MSKGKKAGIIVGCIVVVIVAIVLFILKPWQGTPSVEIYTLTINVSPSGAGSVSPSSGEYESNAQVTLTASPASGYFFDYWSGDVSAIADVNAAATTITMNSDYSITANFGQGQLIQNWYHLDAIRDNPRGSYILMNGLDSTSPGYAELASPTANGGKGWQPVSSFNGDFDGQGYEITDLFISRPEEGAVGLFSLVAEEGIIKHIGLVKVAITSGGLGLCGSLAAHNDGTVSDSYATGSVAGESIVGGLVGWNDGIVNNSYATCIVAGESIVGGLVGDNKGNVSNSCSTGRVSGDSSVGGLVGWNTGTLSNSYATSNVVAVGLVGGLVGLNDHGIVSNSYSNGSVTSNQYVGGLVGLSDEGTVLNSFWDTQTSEQATSGGGTGKTTAEMQDIVTFSSAGWDIITVINPDIRNSAYIWNIVDDETCPFLSWQLVS